MLHLFIDKNYLLIRVKAGKLILPSRMKNINLFRTNSNKFRIIKANSRFKFMKRERERERRYFLMYDILALSELA